MNDDTHIEWRAWGPGAFAEARDADVPILLSLSATWCADCHEMDVETYAEPRVAANVEDGFVPVRVDVDRNPRVRERYNVGGFPSTVFLTPEGALLTGATYLGPDGMRQVLERVREMWVENGAEAGRMPRALADDQTPSGEVTDAAEERIAGQLDRTYDSEFGGWGDDAKFPLPATVEFALKREREQAVRTLEALRRNLFDDVKGGFFRYAERRDWSDVHYEKTLDANAGLVRAFANAYLYTGEESYRDPAGRTVEYLTGTLWNGTAFGGSQGPASGRAYYGLDADERADEPGPRRDLTALAGPNGLAADALLTYHAYTDDERAREYAVRTLDYLESELLDDGAVVRFRDGDDVGESCLLEDHARVAAAFGRAAQVLGDGYVDTARTVADTAVEELHDTDAFRDGPAAGEGLLDRPFRPLDGNVEMADALLDLWLLTGEERYRDAAHDAVAAFAGASDRMGAQVAGYGSVSARLRRDSLVVEVATEPGTDLHRAALRIADHEKVVRPGADGSGATVRVGDRSRRATTPDDLMEAVAVVTDGA